MFIILLYLLKHVAIVLTISENWENSFQSAQLA